MNRALTLLLIAIPWLSSLFEAEIYIHMLNRILIEINYYILSFFFNVKTTYFIEFNHYIIKAKLVLTMHNQVVNMQSVKY